MKILQSQIEDIIQEAIQKWLDNNTKENIYKAVDKLLSTKKDEIILKLLGFDNKWGRGWEIDHCNGRSGNSYAGDYLQDTVKQALNAWLDKINIEDIEIPKTLQENIKNEFIKYTERRIKEKAQEIANQKAEQYINSVLSRIEIATEKLATIGGKK